VTFHPSLRPKTGPIDHARSRIAGQFDKWHQRVLGDGPATLAGVAESPSLVGLIASAALDAELGALVWLLVEADVPLVIAAPPGREAAGAQLLDGILASVRADAHAGEWLTPTVIDRVTAWQLVRGGRPGAVIPAASLEEVRTLLQAAPILLSDEELTFLGCVLVLGSPDGRSQGRLRVTAAHYVRPFARDAHGHGQVLPPAVLAAWDGRIGRYEHFAWGVLPEIASRLGRRAGDLEADLHHRRDDLGGLASAKVTSLDEVRKLIAGYRVGYGHPHGDRAH
jgi:hypothetical protein